MRSINKFSLYPDTDYWRGIDLKLKGLDPNAGAFVDDTKFEPPTPIGGGGKVRPILPADGSETGDVLKRRLPGDPLPQYQVLELLKKAQEQKSKACKTRSRRSFVVSKYLKVRQGQHEKSLQAINLYKEA